MRGAYDRATATRSTSCSRPEAQAAPTAWPDLVAGLTEKPRAVWVMLPAGTITQRTVDQLATLLGAGDIIIDGGNSFYKDDIRNAKALRERGIHYVDVGTSGGVWGLERGYCMMVGGDKAAVDAHRPDPVGAGAGHRRHSAHAGP